MHEAYPDDLRIVYKQLPLRNHFWAQVAAEAAMSAGAQGKFFDFDRAIFTRQREITQRIQEKARELGKGAQGMREADVQQAVFVALAAEEGLDADRVRQDLAAGRFRDRVAREAREAASLGVTGTPGSFINGRYFAGAYPFESFKAEVEKEIKWTKDGNRPDFPKGTSVAQLRPKGSQGRRGPDPTKVYDLKAGNAPFEGSSQAKVTILHYLDYQ